MQGAAGKVRRKDTPQDWSDARSVFLCHENGMDAAKRSRGPGGRKEAYLAFRYDRLLVGLEPYKREAICVRLLERFKNNALQHTGIEVG